MSGSNLEFQQLSDEFARLTSATEDLRSEHAELSASHAAQKASLSAEITQITAQRNTLRASLEEDQKADDWWRKKEASLPRRTAGDELGRAKRAAFLHETRASSAEARMREMEGEHEAAMEAERSIAAGLRDRIGRMEGRLRDLREDAHAMREKEAVASKELREMEERYGREKSKWGVEAQDLKAALRDERRLRGTKEDEVDKLSEALRDSLEETRRLRVAPAAGPTPSRVLTPLEMNIARPQTPPRPTSALSHLKSPTSNPHTPKSLAKAYAYLDKRHAESQAQNRHLEASLQKAQIAIRDLHEQHAADHAKFLEWKQLEDEKSAERKRKREERRRERGESAVDEGPDGKRRKSAEGERAVVGDSEEKGQAFPRAEGEEDKAANTSQTIEGDSSGTREDREAMEVEELEESQEYCSPEDLIVERHPVLASQPRDSESGIWQRMDSAAEMTRLHSREGADRIPAASQRGGSGTQQDRRQATPAIAPVQASQSQRHRTPALRAATPLIRTDTTASAKAGTSSAAPRVGQSQVPSITQTRPSSRAAPTSRIPSSSTQHRPRHSISGATPRRSVSPTKTPAAIPGAVRTTPWLGGGTLVRSSSKPSLMTSVDPFDLSPPEAAESSRVCPSRGDSAAAYNTPSTKPSLVRDRGDASLRKAALARFPSDLSLAKGNVTPLGRTASRSKLGESVNASASGSGTAGAGAGAGSQLPDLGLEGLSPADKARKLKQLNKLSASEKREVYKGYKQEGGRYLAVDQVRRPVTDGYEIDPSKNEGKTHAFHDVKRKKEDRKCMHGGDCEECRDWYEAIGPLPRFNQAPAFGTETTDEIDKAEGIRRHQNAVSRHRETWVKPPTPPGFWSIGFPTTQEVEAQNEKADMMERQKEERIMKDAAASNSKWRKKT